MLLSQAIEGFQISRLADGYSPNTIDVYTWGLDRLTDHLQDPELQDITRTDLRLFMGWLRNDYQPNRMNGDQSPLAGSSVENAWKAIRSFYNWAVIELKIERPDTDLPRPEYAKPEIQPFTEEELTALLKACDLTRSAITDRRKCFQMKRPTAKRDRAIVLLLLDTGVRVSECARLRIKDIDLKSGEIYITPFGSGRKSKSRHVYLGRKSRAALWQYLTARDDQDEFSPLFITDRRGQQMDRSSIRHLVRGLADRAGVKSAYPHKFRHTFAIQYLRNGGDVFTLQRLLGHSTLDMVRRYLAIADADTASAHRRASPVDRWRL